jgi:hypothetical protein
LINLVRNNYMMVLVNTPGRNVLREDVTRFSPEPYRSVHPVENKEQYPSVYLWEKGSFVDTYA